MACVGALGASSAVLSVAPAAAQEPASLEPAGVITLVEDAAWSWFEDARARFSADGTELFVSAVEGVEATAPGTVALVELDLATGDRHRVDLGRGEADDHNSAAIWESPGGELVTSWARHHRDVALRMQRRRTDGSWLRLPPVDTTGRTTYSNLHDAATAEGVPVLYDFYRGDRFDPSVVASSDVGRTWVELGRLLRDPADSIAARPYVQYRSRDGRIDLIATEGHPVNGQTSVYHGYVQAGDLFTSDGVLLGPIGSAVPVTALTPVWTPEGDERGWTADLALDPVTGHPVVAFSVRHSAVDHRYGYARWDGDTWTAEEIALAGTALYDNEVDYTGLLAIDPADPARVVASTDVHPVTGAPLVSATDGQTHWELWEGTRDLGGTWTWTALTADSTADHLRPTIHTGPGGASALLWMRGTYTSYFAYDVDVVGVIRRPGGDLVAQGALAARPAVDVIPTPAPYPQTAIPVTGQLDGHAATDLFAYRPGGGIEQLFLGDEQRHPTAIAASSVNGTYIPIPGDYDGDDRTDIYWYAPGGATDHLWTATASGTFTTSVPRQVLGTYTPIPGDYDGDGRTDIHWYAPGTAPDYLWWYEEGPLSSSEPAVLDL
ncbi:MAG: BNR-4 repeat-containing protein [Acidimicrobiales bacterium]